MDQYFSSEFWRALNLKVLDWLVGTLPSMLFVLLLAFVIQWLFKRFTKRLHETMMKAARFAHAEESLDEKEKRVNTLVNILRQTGKIVIWVVFILVLLREMHIDIAPILASAGIVGLAIGFGAQEFVRDFISGFFMLIENQIREGDIVVINNTAGMVEKIALRTITLRDFSGTVHIFQSGKIDSLSNRTKDWSAAVFDIGVAYKENIGHVKSVMMQVGDALRNDAEFSSDFLEPLEILGLDRFEDSAVVLKARIKTKPGAHVRIGREFNERLKKCFDEEGIEIPFPQRTIYWGDAEKNKDAEKTVKMLQQARPKG